MNRDERKVELFKMRAGKNKRPRQTVKGYVNKKKTEAPVIKSLEPLLSNVIFKRKNDYYRNCRIQFLYFFENFSKCSFLFWSLIKMFKLRFPKRHF